MPSWEWEKDPDWSQCPICYHQDPCAFDVFDLRDYRLVLFDCGHWVELTDVGGD